MNLEEVIEYFNNGIKEAEEFSFLTRSSELQLEKCYLLDALSYNATSCKEEAIRRSLEDDANLFLGYECVIGAVRAELMMWILLKREDPNMAWDCYVAAQMACLDAMRAHSGFVHCDLRREKLNRIESEIFPHQAFLSAGFISDRLDCSICGENYSDCEHLLGKPYIGRFCEVIHRNIRGDHVAIVNTPADKRCRVVSVKTKHGHKDTLSSKITPYEDGESYTGDNLLEVKTIIMALERFPYLRTTDMILGVEGETS